MAVQELALAGDGVLRKKSKEIPQKKISSKEIQNLIEDLFDTVRDEPEEGFVNVGLSAVQISVPKRVFVLITPGSTENGPQFKEYINPEMEILSQQLMKGEESCLSTPHLCGEVQRYKKIQLDYFDREGNKHRDKLSGDWAVYAQHEMDHLNGVLWLDKVTDTKTISYC
jgi:peptide deformylase